MSEIQWSRAACFPIGLSMALSASPALPATAAQTPISGNVIIKQVAVRQEGTNQGVAAEVRRLAADDKSLFFVATDDQGVAAPNQPCIAGDRFEAKPRIPGYLRVDPRPCAETIVFELPSAQATYAMVLLAEDSRKQGDLAKAQLYYAAAAERLARTNPAEALALTNQSRIVALQSLGVKNPTMNVNGEEVLKADAAAKLRQFQRSNKLDPTGTLDAQTRRELGGVTNAQVLQNALKVPPSRVEAYRINPSLLKGAASGDTIAGTDASPPRYELKAMTQFHRGEEVKSAVRAGTIQGAKAGSAGRH